MSKNTAPMGINQISDQIYPVEYEYAGQDVAVVHISINGGESICNEIIRGSVMGKKVDEDGFAICGAVFGLFKPDETTFTEETALMTAESNPIGVFRFESVPFGNWVIRELKPAPAFVLSETLYRLLSARRKKLSKSRLKTALSPDLCRPPR